MIINPRLCRALKVQSVSNCFNDPEGKEQNCGNQLEYDFDGEPDYPEG